MAKQLNKRLVAGVVLVGAACVLGVGVAILSKLPERDPARHVEKAKAFHAAGKADAAAREYLEAFKYDAGNAAHLVRAAQVMWEVGESGKALQFLSRAATIGESEEAQQLSLEIYLTLARTFQSTALWNAVLDQARKIIPSDPVRRADFEKKRPADAAAAYDGRGEAALNRSLGATGTPQMETQGVDDLRRVVFPEDPVATPALEPGNIFAAKALRDYWLGKAATKWGASPNHDADVSAELKLAAAVMATVVKATENSSDPMVATEARLLLLVPFQWPREWNMPPPLLGVFRASDKPAVMQVLENVEKSRPDGDEKKLGTQTMRRWLDVDMTVADHYQRLREYDRAEKALRRAIATSKTDTRPYQVLGLLLRRQGRLDDEEAVYKAALAEAKGEKGFRADLHTQVRALVYDQSLTLEIARRGRTEDESAKKAALDRGEAVFNKAVAELGPDFPVVRVMRARLLREKEQYSAAANELVKADRDPSAGSMALEIKSLLWDLYMRQGLLGAAEKEARALQATGSAQAILMLAKTLLAQEQPRAALDATSSLTDAAEAQSDNADEWSELFALRAEAYRRLGMRAESDRELARVRAASSEPTGPVFAARQAMEAGKLDEAERLLSDLLTKEPANEDGLESMQVLCNRLKKPEKFIPWLKKAIAAKPDDMVLQHLLVYVDPNATEEQRRNAQRDALKEISDPFRRATELYDFSRRINDLKAAQEYLDEAERLKPDNSIVIEEQFRQAIQTAIRDTAGEPAKRWERVEKYARKAAEHNIDQADGKTFQGRVILARLEGNAITDPAERTSAVNRAVDLLRAGLDSYAMNPTAWTHLGEAYQRSGRLGEARAAFQRAIDLRPADGLAHWGLAMIARAQGDRDELEKEIELAYADTRLKDNPQVRAVHDEIQESRDPRRGIERRERVRTATPDDIENLVKLAELYDAAGRPDDALAAFQDAVGREKEGVGATLALVTYYQRTGRCENGIGLLDAALKRELPKAGRISLLITAARLYEVCAVADAARKAELLYQQAHQVDPSGATATEMGAFLMRTGRLRDALKWFEEARERSAADSARVQSISKEIIRLAVVLRDVAKAENLLEEYQAKYKDDQDALMLEGSLAIIKGDASDAMSVFGDAIRRQPDSAMAYWQRGMLYSLVGQMQEAVDDLRKARDLAPGPPKLPTYQHRVQLAQALAALDRPSEAITEARAALTDALRGRPDPLMVNPVAAALVELLLDDDPPRYADAEAVLVDVSGKFPSEPGWILQLGKIAEDQEDYPAALRRYEETLQQSLKDATGATPIAAIQAIVRCHNAMGETGKSAALLSDARTAALVARTPMLGAQLGAARWRTGDEAGGFAEILKSLKPMGLNPLGFRTVMLTLLRDIPLDRLLTQTQSHLAAHADDGTARRLQVCLLLEQSKLSEAEAAGRPLLDAAAPPPERSFMLFLLASHLYSHKKIDESCARYRELIELDPKNVWALNNYAYALSNDLKRPAEGLAYAEQAAAQRPEDATFLDTLGWCQSLAGKHADARGTLFRSLRIMPNYLDARMHLGLTYKAEGRNPKMARQNLEIARKMVSRQIDEMNRTISRRQTRLGVPGLPATRKLSLELELSMLRDAEQELKQSQAKIAEALDGLGGAAAATPR